MNNCSPLSWGLEYGEEDVIEDSWLEQHLEIVGNLYEGKKLKGKKPKKRKPNRMITDCPFANCAINEDGRCVSTNTSKCKEVPPNFLEGVL